MPHPSRPLYRYRARLLRRIVVEPAEDPAVIESLIVHARDASHARSAIAAVTGALVVFEVERLDEVLPADGADAHLAALVVGEGRGAVVFG
jgi:hypothetical protein